MASLAICETREREEAGKEGGGGKREGGAPQVADMRFTILFFVGAAWGEVGEFENMDARVPQRTYRSGRLSNDNEIGTMSLICSTRTSLSPTDCVGACNKKRIKGE